MTDRDKRRARDLAARREARARVTKTRALQQHLARTNNDEIHLPARSYSRWRRAEPLYFNALRDFLKEGGDALPSATVQRTNHRRADVVRRVGGVARLCLARVAALAMI